MNLPPFPVMTGLTQLLPDHSPSVETINSTRRVNLYADADNADRQDWVSDTPTSSGSPRLNNYWDGSQRPSYVLRLRSYWKQVPGTYTHVLPGGGFSKQYTVEHGVSTTDSQTISAQFGVSGEGLSAELTATFEQSVTVTNSQSQSTTYNAGAPADGYTRVWLLWQLVHEFDMVKPEDHSKLIETKQGRGDVDFSNDSHYSGAYLSFPRVHMVFPTYTLMPQQQDFPTQ